MSSSRSESPSSGDRSDRSESSLDASMRGDGMGEMD